MRDPIVLCYHAVSATWKTPLTISPRRLERQVRLLLRRGYAPATFTDALLAPRHEKTFVVTFDDAYSSVATLALPILQRLGVPATLYVPTTWLDAEPRRAGWEDMDQWTMDGHEHELDLMDWDAVRAAAAAGWEIGSHTANHPRLVGVDDATLDAELRESKARVEQELGAPCPSVAYPFGDVDGRVVAAAQRAGYRTGAALPRALANREHTPSTPMNWRRIGIAPTDNIARFATKLAVHRLPQTAPALSVPDPHDGRVPEPAPASPRVAVIIPCFNDGVLAKEAVASATAGEAVEVVVVDDASSDPATAAALDELRAEGVHVVRHEVNRGLPAARNTGLAATTAPYVFPLDSDDLLVEGAITRLADRLDADPEAVATWGDIVEFGSRGRRGRTPLALEGFRVAYRNDYPVCSMFRRDALDAVGGWRDVGGMVGYEDWDLWMTLAEQWSHAVHAGPGVIAVRRRLHGPRMLGDSVRRHTALYAELRRTHPRLFREIREHRRDTSLSWPRRLAYPRVFGARPPLGIRDRWWRLTGALRSALRRRPKG